MVHSGGGEGDDQVEDCNTRVEDGGEVGEEAGFTEGADESQSGA